MPKLAINETITERVSRAKVLELHYQPIYVGTCMSKILYVGQVNGCICYTKFKELDRNKKTSWRFIYL